MIKREPDGKHPVTNDLNGRALGVIRQSVPHARDKDDWESKLDVQPLHRLSGRQARLTDALARPGLPEEDQKTVQWTVFPTMGRPRRCASLLLSSSPQCSPPPDGAP
jgi:hypothetical protein